MDIKSAKQDLLDEVNKLSKKYRFSSEKPDDYYEPGEMENLDQYYGSYAEENGEIIIRTEVKGLRYEGRTPRLECLSVGDSVNLIRDENNKYNSNNFSVLTTNGKSLGNLPADLCNVIAPLYDLGCLTIGRTSVSYLEKIQNRSRYAKQGILFIEIILNLRTI